MQGDIERIRGKGFDSRPQNINKLGRPPGSRNRSTVAKQILSLSIKGIPDAAKKNIIKVFPNLPDRLTVEEIMTLVQVARSIILGDTSAYKALQDSAYGQPKQDVGVSVTQPQSIQYLDVSNYKEVEE